MKLFEIVDREFEELKNLTKSDFSEALAQAKQSHIIYRGASENFIDQFNGRVVDPSKHQRTSQYSGGEPGEFSLNIDKIMPALEGMQPRGNSLMGSTSRQYAMNFAEASHGGIVAILPRNGAILSTCHHDFNLSPFSAFEQVFSRRIRSPHDLYQSVSQGYASIADDENIDLTTRGGFNKAIATISNYVDTLQDDDNMSGFFRRLLNTTDMANLTFLALFNETAQEMVSETMQLSVPVSRLGTVSQNWEVWTSSECLVLDEPTLTRLLTERD